MDVKIDNTKVVYSLVEFLRFYSLFNTEAEVILHNFHNELEETLKNGIENI